MYSIQPDDIACVLDYPKGKQIRKCRSGDILFSFGPTIINFKLRMAPKTRPRKIRYSPDFLVYVVPCVLLTYSAREE